MRENLTYGLKRQGVETRMNVLLNPRRHPLTLPLGQSASPLAGEAQSRSTAWNLEAIDV